MRRASAALIAGLMIAAGSAVGAEPEPQGIDAPPAPEALWAQIAAAPAGTRGKVVETMDAGGYTYVRVDTGLELMWAVAPQFPVRVGDTVTVPADGMPMANYHSKTLDRTFDLVHFVALVAVEGAEDGAPRPAPGFSGRNPPAGGDPSAIDFSDVEKTEGGQTIGEIFEAKGSLAGREVFVRGKVVKFTANIMGRNWLHLRDGTAGPSGGNDLTVTTSDSAEVGNTVVVRGVLTTDKDFGAGYRYDAIIENASITVE